MKYPSESKYWGPVWEFILEYKRTHDGNFPAIREICAGVDCPSTSTVAYVLAKMQRHGWLERRDDKICVVGGTWAYRGKKNTA